MEEKDPTECEYAPSLWLGAHRCSTHTEVLELGAEIATKLAKIIKDKELFMMMHGKAHVMVEGWGCLAAMLGLVPSFREVRDCDGTGKMFEATVDLLRADTGERVGGSSAICGGGEKPWASRDVYTRSSMAQTRAIGKAVRMGYSWIMKLAGYEVTPAEEMPDDLAGFSTSREAQELHARSESNKKSVAEEKDKAALAKKRVETAGAMSKKFAPLPDGHAEFVDLLGRHGLTSTDEVASMEQDAYLTFYNEARKLYDEILEEQKERGE